MIKRWSSPFANTQNSEWLSPLAVLISDFLKVCKQGSVGRAVRYPKDYSHP